MVKVPPAKIASFRCRCYPRIDPVTREMEWWVTKEYFQDIEARTGSVINDLMNYSTGEQPQEQPQQIQTFEQPQPSGLTA